MRKITPAQIGLFLCLLFLSLALAVATALATLGALKLGDYRGIAVVSGVVAFHYVYSLIIYRIFMDLFPLLPGEIPPGSRQEFIYHVHVLFFLMVFYPVMRSGIPPAPFMRSFYLALGARLGSNTYSQGLIHDPLFVSIGHDSVVGQGALLIPHVIEGERLAHYPIRIGSHVTIGANAVVLAGVEIGDHAIVATASVVTKGTRIGAGEIWAGVPARLVRRTETGSRAAAEEEAEYMPHA